MPIKDLPLDAQPREKLAQRVRPRSRMPNCWPSSCAPAWPEKRFADGPGAAGAARRWRPCRSAGGQPSGSGSRQGLGPAKRAELMAVLELARRATAQQLREREVFPPRGRQTLSAAASGSQEPRDVCGAVLDSQNRLLALEEMFRGTLTQTSVYPGKWCCAPSPPCWCRHPGPQSSQRQRTAQQRRPLPDHDTQGCAGIDRCARAGPHHRGPWRRLLDGGGGSAMNHAHRSLQDLAGVSRQLKLAREQAEALAAAQAEARAARERERNLFALSVGKVSPLRARNEVSFQDPPPSPAFATGHGRAECAARGHERRVRCQHPAGCGRPAELSPPRHRSRCHAQAARRPLEHSAPARSARAALGRSREALGQFIRLSHRTGVRCVRIVHGKGLGSPGRTPVLKGKVQRWLVQKRKSWPLSRRAPQKAVPARSWCCCSRASAGCSEHPFQPYGSGCWDMAKNTCTRELHPANSDACHNAGLPLPASGRNRHAHLFAYPIAPCRQPPDPECGTGRLRWR